MDTLRRWLNFNDITSITTLVDELGKTYWEVCGTDETRIAIYPKDLKSYVYLNPDDELIFTLKPELKLTSAEGNKDGTT